MLPRSRRSRSRTRTRSWSRLRTRTWSWTYGASRSKTWRIPWRVLQKSQKEMGQPRRTSILLAGSASRSRPGSVIWEVGLRLHAFPDLPNAPNGHILNPKHAQFRLDSLPTQTRHCRYTFINSGLFFPIMFLIFFNYNVVVGVSAQNMLLKILSYVTISLFLLVAFRGKSELKGGKLT